MQVPELFTILGWILLWAAVVGVLTVVLLRLLRGASILVQIFLVVIATVAVLVAGMVSAFNAMFISARDLEVMWYILGIASAVAAGIALMLGAGVSANARRLVAAAQRIGRGEELDEETPAMNAELARLAEELASSSRSLEESRRREAAIEGARRELVAWISHDLRTPLASMRAMAEALEDGMATDVAAYYRGIIGQTDQMAAMVNDLLELSRIQAGTMRLSTEPVDLYDLVSDAIADLSPLARRRNISLDGGGERQTLAAADGPSLGRAVRNVVHNAILYSPPDSSVHLDVGHEGGDAVVAVQDSCGGIADDDLPHLFEAGWHKDRAGAAPQPGSEGGSSGRYSGAGVGLSMVSGIVRAHGGTVTVENNDGGCRFELRLPAGAS
ncbi:sensor histidine kinase KdpD [Arthrobacter sp. M4]|uniref:sensor histidine kinase n=1 Tax=Arthrobacter sp. M4 TaxID=218160 RepID=UPI001CDB71B3|nr:HAMP domain-containing sensor histidine kinase [Arthrobacter sp. M4]MCA4134630.1 HAMP domain-containing histidine kinase [Arthrobacter sp. M4]